jgi:hypothetical protein
MVLRGADYPRKANEDYRTPAEPVLALIPHLVDIRVAWIPSDRGDDSVLAATLRAHGIETVSTDVDFLTVREPPAGADAIVDNPPFGRAGTMAVAFAAHALQLMPFTALLLPVDFDSARSRTHLFRDCPSFAGRLILLQRIVWFSGGPASPSTNHMWAIWDAGRDHRSPPSVHYQAESNLPTRRRRHPSLVATNAFGRGVTAVASSKGSNDHE